MSISLSFVQNLNRHNIPFELIGRIGSSSYRVMHRLQCRRSDWTSFSFLTIQFTFIMLLDRPMMHEDFVTFNNESTLLQISMMSHWVKRFSLINISFRCDSGNADCPADKMNSRFLRLMKRRTKPSQSIQVSCSVINWQLNRWYL